VLWPLNAETNAAGFTQAGNMFGVEQKGVSLGKGVSGSIAGCQLRCSGCPVRVCATASRPSSNSASASASHCHCFGIHGFMMTKANFQAHSACENLVDLVAFWILPVQRGNTQHAPGAAIGGTSALRRTAPRC